jgi:hypothetical protein
MTTSSTDYQLPKVLRVTTGTVYIPVKLDADNLREYETVNREITHLLALIPDEDKAQVERDDDGDFLISTNNLAALKYAIKHHLIDEFVTIIDTVIDSVLHHYDGDVCDTCVDNFVEEALEYEYEAVVLNDGVYLKRGDL